jgi:hypothetical protein
VKLLYLSSYSPISFFYHIFSLFGTRRKHQKLIVNLLLLQFSEVSSGNLACTFICSTIHIYIYIRPMVYFLASGHSIFHVLSSKFGHRSTCHFSRWAYEALVSMVCCTFLFRGWPQQHFFVVSLTLEAHIRRVIDLISTFLL